MEAKDIYGNTALGISMLKKHFTYCILLIQKKADVKSLVWDEFPGRINKLWQDQQKSGDEHLDKLNSKD